MGESGSAARPRTALLTEETPRGNLRIAPRDGPLIIPHQGATRAVISIGTNSTRAWVAQIGEGVPGVVLQRSIGTRIGEGLRESGHLQEAAMQRTLDAIGEHMRAIREHTPGFRVIATSALRRADNREDFIRRVRDLTGAEIDIISGEEEAACSFAGALSGVPAKPGERFGVLDVGGGSSEYAVGTNRELQSAVSCEIGAVRLTEAFPALAGLNGVVGADTLESARKFAAAALQPALALPAVDRVVLVGGSATTAVSIVRARREFFSYAEISLHQIGAIIARVSAMPLDERKAVPGMNPQRADILLGGLLIIERFCTALCQNTPLVSTSDVLLGYLLRHPI